MRAFLATLFLFLSVNAFSCMGGIYPISDKITLYGASLAVGGQTFSNLSVGDKFERGDTKVEVLFIKSDFGGTLYTVYEVKSPEEDKAGIVKVKTNYMGNGMRTRGMLVREPKADKVVGCGGH